MLLSIEAMNAAQGDCLLVHFGTAADLHHAIIDGGPRKTFPLALEPRLRELRDLHGLDENESLPVDLLVVTHTDADHIEGISAMTEELCNANGEMPWRIERLWYNSFDDIVGNDQVASIQSLEASASPKARAFIASIGQGQKLRDMAERLLIPVNEPADVFAGGLVARPDHATVSVDLPGALKLAVLSPTTMEMRDLQKEWDKYVKSHPPGRARGGAASVEPDSSVTNLSSIALLAEVGAHRILLAGDARADQILAGLEAHGVLPHVGGSFEVDVLKLGHHGSCRNNTQDLFDRVRARYYVISADGTDDNPDCETLQMLWKARGGDNGWELCLTFPRDAFERVEGSSAREVERRNALQAVQRWINKNKVPVRYREPDALGISIHLGDEELA